MSREIIIEPVTRVEGHGKITLYMNDDGAVDNARFHVTQFRGFEKFVEGRPMHEMPSLTARICGICPVSHMLASGKAADALLTVSIPPTAHKLRMMLNYAQYVQSHALSFFHLSSPDLLLGFDSDPATRNVVGLIAANPELAVKGIRLRQIGQKIIDGLASKRIHAPWVVPGGVNQPLSEEKRDEFLGYLPEAYEIAQEAIDLFKAVRDQFPKEAEHFGNFPSLFMGLISDEGGFEFYDGNLRVVDENGQIIADGVKAADYQEIIGEGVEPFSYMKFPYYRPYGFEKGMYRVGPLGRCNVVDHAGTPRADRELVEFRGGSMDRNPVLTSFYTHWARLIEMLHSVEKLEELLTDEKILNPRVRAKAEPNADDGVGIIEAPRGTLIHHYKIDEFGLMTWANLIVATGHNNLAINKGVLQVAKAFVNGNKLQEGMLNRCEALVRCYDPCLSCATHALGKMPLQVELLNTKGEVLDRLLRD